MIGKKRLILIQLILSIFLFSTLAFANPSADIFYIENDLGGGSWQYDYTLYNTSDSGEYLYSLDLIFNQLTAVTGSPLPPGWGSTQWEGEYEVEFLNTYSENQGYDIVTGSSLNGFSIITNYQTGSIQYNAYFDDHQGGIYYTSGFTIVPEPVSSMLLLSGGAVFIVRRYFKRTKRNN